MLAKMFQQKDDKTREAIADFSSQKYDETLLCEPCKGNYQLGQCNQYISQNVCMTFVATTNDTTIQPVPELFKES